MNYSPTAYMNGHGLYVSPEWTPYIEAYESLGVDRMNASHFVVSIQQGFVPLLHKKEHIDAIESFLPPWFSLIHPVKSRNIEPEQGITLGFDYRYLMGERAAFINYKASQFPRTSVIPPAMKFSETLGSPWISASYQLEQHRPDFVDFPCRTGFRYLVIGESFAVDPHEIARIAHPTFGNLVLLEYLLP